jgi:predicted nucleic acid-binding protein
MKGLDTPVLVSILQGEPRAKMLLRRLRGEELASSELNFLELEFLVGRAAGPTQPRRRIAVGRLRRGLTILPLDGRASEKLPEISRRKEARGLNPLVVGALACFAAYGCDELVTSDQRLLAGRWPFKATKFA